MVDPPAVGPLGAADGALAEDAGAEAAGADAGAVVGTLDVGEVVAALLHAAVKPPTTMMAAAMSFLECMSHLVRSRRTNRGGRSDRSYVDMGGPGFLQGADQCTETDTAGRT
jgi:hypothetical protein